MEDLVRNRYIDEYIIGACPVVDQQFEQENTGKVIQEEPVTKVIVRSERF